MTRKTLNLSLLSSLMVYGGVTWYCIRYFDKPGDQIGIVGVTTGLLGTIAAYLFQRRVSFLDQLRTTVSACIRAVEEAIYYCELPTPTLREQLDVLKTLSIAIEEIRAVYRNVKDAENGVGLFPLESLKQIHDSIKRLPSGAQDPGAKRAAVRIKVDWGHARKALLSELDRAVPTYTTLQLDEPRGGA